MKYLGARTWQYWVFLVSGFVAMYFILSVAMSLGRLSAIDAKEQCKEAEKKCYLYTADQLQQCEKSYYLPNLASCLKEYPIR